MIALPVGVRLSSSTVFRRNKAPVPQRGRFDHYTTAVRPRPIELVNYLRQTVFTRNKLKGSDSYQLLVTQHEECLLVTSFFTV
jgi:hypothetical protein